MCDKGGRGGEALFCWLCVCGGGGGGRGCGEERKGV